MKFGLRIPSLSRMIAARLSVRRNLVHRLGIKMPRGYGWVRDPERAAYNAVYNRTSFSAGELLGWMFRR